VRLPLTSGDRLLRPTFAALVAAEGEIGSLFQMLDRVANGEVRLAEMAALFWHCLSEPEDRGVFEAELLECGPANLLPALRGLLSAVFRAG
jgi:hypothetical protein